MFSNYESNTYIKNKKPKVQNFEFPYLLSVSSEIEAGGLCVCNKEIKAMKTEGIRILFPDN